MPIGDEDAGREGPATAHRPQGEDEKPTFEAAKLCPTCSQPGEDTGSTPSRSPSTGMIVSVHRIFCRNKVCPWFNTMWIIQINPDGSVPKPYSQLGNKQYPHLSQETETRVQEAIQEQLRQETRPGGSEVRNPHG